jgi:hypothetical protein
LRVARRLLVPPLAVALGAAALSTAGFVALTSGAQADAATALPQLTGFHQMVVDSTDGYIFLSEGSTATYVQNGNAGASGIVVADLSGNYVTTLDAGDGVEGLALDGSTLYAALAITGQVAAIDASTSAFTQTAYSLSAGDVPYSVAVQSGDVWVSYDAKVPGSGAAVGDISLSTGTFEPATAGSDWYTSPDLAADPSDSGVLAGSVSESPDQVAIYSTTTDPATDLAPLQSLGISSSCEPAVAPGGGEFITNCYSAADAEAYAVANLTTATASYADPPIPTVPNVIAVSPDGDIAVGSSQEVYVYQPDGSLVDTYQLSNAESLVSDGLSWSADGSVLYAVADSEAGTYSAGPITGFVQQTSTVTLTPPASAPLAGAAATITGQLTFSDGTPAAGTTILVADDGPGGSVTDTTVETDNASGGFVITEAPAALGTYTITAQYSGGTGVSGSQASTSFTVSMSESKVGLSAPSGDFLGVRNTISGTLTFDDGVTPAAATPITVTRVSPGGGTPVSMGAVATNGTGAFSFTDTPPSAGSYTYTASFAGDPADAPATGTLAVTAAARRAVITLSGPSSIAPGKSFTISGDLTITPGASSDDRATISVVRTNPNHTTTPSTVRTSATGAFTIPGTLTALGEYSYAVSYAGSPSASSANATRSLTVGRQSTTLTLSTGAPTALYDSTVHVTVHLGSTDTNRTVSVYYQLVGTGTRKLLKTAKVSSSGILVLSYPGATRNVIFSATFSGDAQYFPRSISVRLGVDVRVAMANSGWYTTTKFNGGTYHVFHSNAHLNVAVSVTPNKHGEKLELVGQQWYNNTWNDVSGDVFTYTLPRTSSISGYLTLAQVTGAYFRLRAVFIPGSTDVTNVSYYSGWFYFTVVR